MSDQNEQGFDGTIEEVEKGVTQITEMDSVIAELRERYANVHFDVDTKDGLEAAKKARKEIREPRYLIENTRKAAKRPIIDLGKRLDAKAKKMTELLLEIEEPIDEAIKTEERKEEERQNRIGAALHKIRAAHADLVVSEAGSAEIEKALAELEEVDPTTFDEFEITATEAIETAKASLGVLLSKVRQREEDERELAELREKKEAEERERREKERKEREAAEAKEREERARIEKENEELRKRNAEETKRREAAERREQEQIRLAEEAERERLREENERAHEEDRRAKEAEALAKRSRYPGHVSLVAGVAAYFKVEPQTAEAWLKHYQG